MKSDGHVVDVDEIMHPCWIVSIKDSLSSFAHSESKVVEMTVLCENQSKS